VDWSPRYFSLSAISSLFCGLASFLVFYHWRLSRGLAQVLHHIHLVILLPGLLECCFFIFVLYLTWGFSPFPRIGACWAVGGICWSFAGEEGAPSYVGVSWGSPSSSCLERASVLVSKRNRKKPLPQKKDETFPWMRGDQFVSTHSETTRGDGQIPMNCPTRPWSAILSARGRDESAWT